MSTYYIDGMKYNKNYTQEMENLTHKEGAWDEALGYDDRTAIFACRVHGNPFYDQSTIIRQESPAVMRGQDKVYEDALATGDDPYSFKKVFSALPEAWDANIGLHFISEDDEMLVEKGEEYVHKQFIDYLVYPEKPEKHAAEWQKLCRRYLERIFINTIHSGHVPPAVASEPTGQYWGLPYEWHGAPIDD